MEATRSRFSRGSSPARRARSDGEIIESIGCGRSAWLVAVAPVRSCMVSLLVASPRERFSGLVAHPAAPGPGSSPVFGAAAAKLRRGVRGRQPLGKTKRRPAGATGLDCSEGAPLGLDAETPSPWCHSADVGGPGAATSSPKKAPAGPPGPNSRRSNTACELGQPREKTWWINVGASAATGGGAPPWARQGPQRSADLRSGRRVSAEQAPAGVPQGQVTDRGSHAVGPTPGGARGSSGGGCRAAPGCARRPGGPGPWEFRPAPAASEPAS